VILPALHPVVLSHPLVARINVPFFTSLTLKTSSGNPFKVPSDEFTVSIAGPAEEFPAKVTPAGDAYDVTFTPTDVGDFAIIPLLGGYPLFEEPVTVKVVGEVDPEKCEVIIPKEVSEDKLPVVFQIIPKDKISSVIPFDDIVFDVTAVPVTDNAVAHLELSPEILRVVHKSHGIYEVTWAPPKQPVDYDVHVHYNNNPLLHAPFRVRITAVAHGPSSQIEIISFLTVTVKIVVFTIRDKPTRKFTGGDKVDIEVHGMDKKLVPHVAKDNSDGTYSVTFVHEAGIGEFEVSARVNGEEVENSPVYYRAAD